MEKGTGQCVEVVVPSEGRCLLVEVYELYTKPHNMPLMGTNHYFIVL